MGLLHDATEAYLADVPKPVKQIMPDYERIEKIIWARIAHKFFGAVIELPPIVHDCDGALLAAKACDQFPTRRSTTGFAAAPAKMSRS